jgi:membrane protein
MIITTTQEQVEVPGGKAERPAQIPARGWTQVAKRGWKEAKADQVPLLAAGVAFYAFLAIFPALIAIVSIYGLFADPSTIANQLNSITAALLRRPPSSSPTRSPRSARVARPWASASYSRS